MSILQISTRISNKQTALTKGEENYEWFVFTALKAVLSNSKGRTIHLVKNSQFGVRRSANGRQLRLIVAGEPTKVFTLSKGAAEYLSENCKALSKPANAVSLKPLIKELANTVVNYAKENKELVALKTLVKTIMKVKTQEALQTILEETIKSSATKIVIKKPNKDTIRIKVTKSLLSDVSRLIGYCSDYADPEETLIDRVEMMNLHLQDAYDALTIRNMLLDATIPSEKILKFWHSLSTDARDDLYKSMYPLYKRLINF